MHIVRAIMKQKSLVSFSKGAVTILNSYHFFDNDNISIIIELEVGSYDNVSLYFGRGLAHILEDIPKFCWYSYIVSITV